jgi:hypothetical protein
LSAHDYGAVSDHATIKRKSCSKMFCDIACHAPVEDTSREASIAYKYFISIKVKYYHKQEQTFAIV